MSTPTALHSKKTQSWGTPQHMIELGRQLLDNDIQLDPGSSPEFNQLVKALLFYTKEDNALIQPWAGNVFCNPPGGLIREYWERLMVHLVSGDVPKAFWVGFSVEQLCLLADFEFHPLDFSTCILRKRMAFNTEALVKGDAPSHGNYVTAMGCDRALFDKLFRDKGKIIHGVLA